MHVAVGEYQDPPPRKRNARLCARSWVRRKMFTTECGVPLFALQREAREERRSPVRYF